MNNAPCIKQQAWRPIEKAPKTGVAILAFMVGTDPQMNRVLGDKANGIDIIYWTRANKGGWVSSRYGEPTHWMPLPEPPQ